MNNDTTTAWIRGFIQSALMNNKTVEDWRATAQMMLQRLNESKLNEKRQLNG